MAKKTSGGKTKAKTGSKGAGKSKRARSGTSKSLFPALPADAVTVRALRADTAPVFAVKSGAEPEAQTIIYVHGIGNKPPASVLKCQWDSALFGVELGDRSRLAYWVNREFYPTPSDDTCNEEDLVAIDDDEASTQSIMALARQEPTSEGDAVADPLNLPLQAGVMLHSAAVGASGDAVENRLG